MGEFQMKRECIEELIKARREIEFKIRGQRYSITYSNQDCEKPISVCRFYHKAIDVRNADEVLSLKIGNYTLEQIFSVLPDSAFDIF